MGTKSDSTNITLKTGTGFAGPNAVPNSPGSSSTNLGTKVVFTDEFLEAIRKVRDDTSGVKWCVGSYVDGDIKKQVGLVKMGQTGAEDMKKCFSKDSICYGLIRVVDKVDGHGKDVSSNPFIINVLRTRHP